MGGRVDLRDTDIIRMLYTFGAHTKLTGNFLFALESDEFAIHTTNNIENAKNSSGTYWTMRSIMQIPQSLDLWPFQERSRLHLPQWKNQLSTEGQ